MKLYIIDDFELDESSSGFSVLVQVLVLLSLNFLLGLPVLRSVLEWKLYIIDDFEPVDDLSSGLSVLVLVLLALDFRLGGLSVVTMKKADVQKSVRK